MFRKNKTAQVEDCEQKLARLHTDTGKLLAIKELSDWLETQGNNIDKSELLEFLILLTAKRLGQ